MASPEQPNPGSGSDEPKNERPWALHMSCVGGEVSIGLPPVPYTEDTAVEYGKNIGIRMLYTVSIMNGVMKHGITDPALQQIVDRSEVRTLSLDSYLVICY